MTRNFPSALMLIIATMTGCLSFTVPRRTPVFNRAYSLYASESTDPEFPVIPDNNAQANDDGSSSFMGIDEEFVPFPHRDYTAPDVVKLCMDSLGNNNEPFKHAGLEVCWNFSSDRCRAAQGGSLDSFIQYARNPIFASMVDAREWEAVSVGPIIQGTATRGAMQTVLVNVVPQNGEARRFLWTLQQERRPPRQGCWLVWECLSVENAYSHTL